MGKTIRLETTRNMKQGDLNPIGMIVASFLSEAQFQAANGSGWTLAHGQSVSGSTYHTTTGLSNVPDLRGRVIAGIDNMGGLNANNLTASNFPNRNNLGGTGGADTHTLTGAQSGEKGHTHAASSVSGSIGGSDGTHIHGITEPNSGLGHSHTLPFVGHNVASGTDPAGLVYSTTDANYNANYSTTGITVNSTNSGHGHAHTLTASGQTITASNATSAHNNTQPTLVANYFIKINY